MKQITQDEYSVALALHEKWLRDEPDGVRMVFREIDFSLVNFGTRAYLTEANLSGADLTRAYLTEADLTSANLTGANLSGADLTGADITGADLTRANLTGANLYGADLYEANLTGANGDKLTLVGDRPLLTIGPIGSRADCLQIFITDQGVRLSTGCFQLGTVEAFREALSQTHGDNVHAQEYEAALALVEMHTKLWDTEK